jgi:CheY-like chemotaxis protein
VGRTDFPTDSLLGVHVLVVDDDFDSRVLLRTVLEYCGALVTVTSSAEEALITLRRVVPDVLVADIAMPDHDGYWLVRQVRSLPKERGGSIPAVAVTGYREAHGAERTLAAGYHAHLTKPIDPWELSRTVATLARRS